MKIGDTVYVKRTYDGGYWMGEIREIREDTAVIFGNDYKYNYKGISYVLRMIKKLKEEDMMYKQWAYWEK